MQSKTIKFVTTNTHKVIEARSVLKAYPLHLEHINVSRVEIQAESVETIAKYSALQAAKDYTVPLIVEDTGLFIDALNGFPGPYASHVYATISTTGILKLLKDVNNRRAFFRSAVAFCDSNRNLICFTGVCLGSISMATLGTNGFGFDPIFKPELGSGKTFGEMEFDEKISMSHRSIALRKFANWYTTIF